MDIASNLKIIEESLCQLASQSGKNREDITLIAVSKTVDVDKIKEALNAGITDIGENKVQELVRKHGILGDVVRYHMIGNLQTNKVKDILGKVTLIHSLDRLSLLQELEKRGKKINQSVDTLIQLNIGKEDTKSGLYEEDLVDFVKEIEKCEYVKVKGLMTVAPFVENPDEVRWVFQKMKQIFDELSSHDYKNIEMKFLSMGMSHDYQVAIEEGANMIRIGTSIFGERDYSK